MAKKIAAEAVQAVSVPRVRIPLWAFILMIAMVVGMVAAFPVTRTTYPVAAGQAVHTVVYQTVSVEKPSMLPVYKITERVPLAATWLR